jgi:hypothetical protein
VQIEIESIKGGKPTISVSSDYKSEPGYSPETVEQIAEAYLKLKSLISGRKRKPVKKVKQEVVNANIQS